MSSFLAYGRESGWHAVNTLKGVVSDAKCHGFWVPLAACPPVRATTLADKPPVAPRPGYPCSTPRPSRRSARATRRAIPLADKPPVARKTPALRQAKAEHTVPL